MIMPIKTNTNIWKVGPHGESLRLTFIIYK